MSGDWDDMAMKERSQAVATATMERTTKRAGSQWLEIIPPDDVILPMWEDYSRDPQNQRLRNRIAERYIPAVEYTVKRLFGNKPDFANIIDDLFVEASIAMMTAVERYRVESGNKFWTFADRRIRGACVDYVRSISDCNRTQMRHKKRIEKFREEWVLRNGLEPSCEEIAIGLKLSVENVVWLDRWKRPKYLSEIIFGSRIDNGDRFSGADGRPTDLAMLLADKSKSHADDAEIADFIELACRGCTEVERAIIVENLVNGTATMKQLGKRFGMSESRISQITTTKILPRLRERLSERYDEIPTCLVKG